MELLVLLAVALLLLLAGIFAFARRQLFHSGPTSTQRPQNTALREESALEKTSNPPVPTSNSLPSSGKRKKRWKKKENEGSLAIQPVAPASSPSPIQQSSPTTNGTDSKVQHIVVFSYCVPPCTVATERQM
jgi:cytoskeletal protein RodZ